MTVTVKFFAVLREILRRDKLTVEVSPGASCRDTLIRLEEEFPALGEILERCFLAVNGVYADQDTRMSAGDELAILPPVSGG